MSRTTSKFYTYLSIAFLSIFVSFVVTQFKLSSLSDSAQTNIEENVQPNQILEELVHREVDFTSVYSSLSKSLTPERQFENFKYQFIVKSVALKTDSPPPEC